jgi:ribonuclease J
LKGTEVKPQKLFEYDGTLVKLYGGFGEVGGNCVVVEDRDRKLVFDYGVRFSLMRRFYGGRVEPLGPVEMSNLGIVPDPTVTEGASAVYISHLHLDHVGLLSAVDSSTRIVLPDRDVAKATIGNWYERSHRWLAYVVPQWSSTASAKLLSQDENSVVAIPVSHSAYPAMSFLYLGRGRTLFYSGDFRLQALVQLNPPLEEVLKKLGVDSVDVAIVEATNIGSRITLVTRSGFDEVVRSSVEVFNGVTVSVDPHDLESMLYLYRIAEESGRDVVVASERILWMLRLIYERNPKDLSRTLVAQELSRPPPVSVGSVSLAGEVFRDMGSYIVIAEPVHLLEILRKLKTQGMEVDLTGTVALLLDPEPRETVREVENTVLARWLGMFGAQVLRVRFSGHYHPHHFKHLIQVLKPRRLIPVHTENPELVLRLFEKYSTSLKTH